MTKRLILMRHGEAENPTMDQSDADRNLTATGQEQARLVGQKIQVAGWLPEAIFYSSAERTQQTAAILSSSWSVKKQPSQELYLASYTAIFEFILQLDNSLDSVAIVGHNPGLSHVIDYLTGKFISLSTANAALIQFEIDEWELVTKGMGSLVKLLTP